MNCPVKVSTLGWFTVVPSPSVQLDLRQFLNALERVMEFARVSLPQAGELEIEAGLRQIDWKRYAELKIGSPFATSSGVEERDVYRPFLLVDGYQVGLDLELTGELLRRHPGKIFFQSQNPHPGMFAFLLKARGD